MLMHRNVAKKPWLKLSVVLCALASLAGLLPGAAGAQGTASVGAIFGLVISENGVPLEGADVFLEGFGSAYTDSHGRFIFRSVPPGNYRISANKQGFASGPSRSITVRAGVTEQMRIALGGLADLSTYVGRVSVPLIRGGNSLFVRALLNGRREGIFILDTGASYTTISSAVAQELGISFGPGSPSVTLMTASGMIEAPVSTLPSIQVGGVEAKDVVVVVHDLPGQTRIASHDLPPSSRVVGLLGLSFLSRFQFLIDAEQGFMILGQ